MSAELVILINILFYLFGFSFFLYKRNQLSEQSIAFLSIIINFIGVLFSMGIRLSDISGDVITYNWFYISDKLFTIDILLNDLTYLMYFLVQFIALWVQVFSLKYMQGDPSFGRYYAYLNLFILAMIGIIISRIEMSTMKSMTRNQAEVIADSRQDSSFLVKFLGEFAFV